MTSLNICYAHGGGNGFRLGAAAPPAEKLAPAAAPNDAPAGGKGTTAPTGAPTEAPNVAPNVAAGGGGGAAAPTGPLEGCVAQLSTLELLDPELEAGQSPKGTH